MFSEDIKYRLFKELDRNPEMSQRELSQRLGISLGKTNFCIRALIEAGWVKAGNFAKSKKKFSYAYILTPSGVKEKVRVTVCFLDYKKKEFKLLKKEIENLKRELGDPE